MSPRRSGARVVLHATSPRGGARCLHIPEGLPKCSESRRAEEISDLTLRLPRLSAHGRIELSATSRQPDEARAPVVRVRPQHQVSETLKVAQEVVHRLFRNAHLFREAARALSVQGLEAEQSNMSAGEIGVPRRDHATIDPIAHALPCVPQEASDPRAGIPCVSDVA